MIETKKCEFLFISSLVVLYDWSKILWDLKNLMGTSFQKSKILWDFISQCDMYAFELTHNIYSLN